MTTTLLSPVAGRFAWKEYRTLRTMWLAVLLLGLVMQLVCRALAAPGADVPAMLFGLALGTTIMFAVGAAAVLFSAEHEDETYQFLSGLPLRWLPMTLGKLAVATLSAMALALVLLVFGWATEGGKWPSSLVASQLTALLGLGVFEALAWATMFSLLVKRPLTAVALALVVGTLAVQLAAAAMATQPLALADVQSYSQAVPLRLAIVTAVFACALVVARRWLAADASAAQRKSRTAMDGEAADGTITPIANWAAAARASRLWQFVAKVWQFTQRRWQRVCQMPMARLLWQTWRQSWRSLLVPFAVTACLWFLALLGVVSVPREVSDELVPLFGLVGFFLPALFGALAFSGDQRRRQYRFLAEHAGRPRYVWLARHTVWLGALVVFLCGLALVAIVASAHLMNYGLRQYVEQQRWMWQPPQMDAYELRTEMFYFLSGTGLAGFGALIAYAIGQLSSMLFRSEIIAAFVALVLSAVVAVWAAVLLLWNLSGWWFMLPLALGCLLATWLRAPDWIIERNSWRAWSKPALAVAAPLALVGALIPPTRLGQVPDQSSAMKTQIDWYRAGDTPEARETAAMYERAIEIEDSWWEHDPLKKWLQENPVEGGELDIESNLSEDQREGYERAHSDQQMQVTHTRNSAFELAVEASQRPTCRFDANWVATTIPARYDPNWDRRESAWENANRTFEHLLVLASDLAVSPQHNNGINVDRLVAAVTLCDHLRQGQPTAVAVRTLEVEGRILDSIAGWAVWEEQITRTPAELRELGNDEREAQQAEKMENQLGELGERLQKLFAKDVYTPDESLVADHLLVRDVLLGKSSPLSFDRETIPWSTYLAFLANELPWERERALRALDAVTLANISDVKDMQDFMDGKGHYSWNATMLQRWLLPNSGPRWPPAWTALQFHARSSYLMSMEYELRVPINEFYRQLAENKARRRALLLQIALLRYRHDHGQYPLTLAKLVPDYLKELPLDPYSGQPFNYSPFGLDLPLRRYVYSGGDLIPQETPLIWSVGPGSARLTRYESVYDTADEDPMVEPTRVRTEYYTLLSSGVYWNNDSALVFPLPK